MTTMQPFFLYPYLIHKESPGELDAAQKSFGANRVSTDLSQVPSGSLVIPRFRMLPFGRALQEEVEFQGSKLVNTYHQHRQVANIFSWAHLLEGLTPACYTLQDLPHLPEGEYFVKGETNSLKHSWFSSAYAPNRQALLETIFRVQADLTTGSQEVVIRPYQHYRELCKGVDGRPIFHERRVFLYRSQVLSQGFYWSSYVEEVGNTVALDENAYEDTLRETIKRVGHLLPLLVIDLVEYPNGSWGVVELNDGTMSGFSMNDPEVVWGNFMEAHTRPDTYVGSLTYADYPQRG